MNKKGGDAGSYRCVVQTPLGAVSSKTVTLLTAGKYLNWHFFWIYNMIVDIAFCFHCVMLNSTMTLSGTYVVIVYYVICIQVGPNF